MKCPSISRLRSASRILIRQRPSIPLLQPTAQPYGQPRSHRSQLHTNSEPTQRNDTEEFAKALNSFNSKLQTNDIMKVTALAKTWMSNLRRVVDIKKDFDKTKNNSNIAYNRIISDSTSNEAKYLIDIVEEEISEAESARTKTSEILTLLERKVEAMTEAEVGNNEQLRNKAIDIISSEASNLKNIYMARKRETKRQVVKLKKSHAACSPSKLKFSGKSKKDPPMLTLEKLTREWKCHVSKR